MKPADQLSPSDFKEHRVWEFDSHMEAELPDETFMRPVLELPVFSLSGRVVGAELTLANGQVVLGVLGNIDLGDPVSTEHFLTVTVFTRSGGRFDLARYHDVDYARHGPTALAPFLGLEVTSVFPIRYDVSDVAVGNAECLRRSILAVPVSRLSQEKLIELAVK
jgi:hypothetical protein